MAMLFHEPQQPPTKPHSSARAPEARLYKGDEDRRSGNKGDIDRSSQADRGCA